jgi:hypothetical protein
MTLLPRKADHSANKKMHHRRGDWRWWVPSSRGWPGPISGVRGAHDITQRKAPRSSAGGPLIPDELLMIDASPSVRVGPRPDIRVLALLKRYNKCGAEALGEPPMFSMACWRIPPIGRTAWS